MSNLVVYGSFQLVLQTLSLVAGFMAWSIIAPLMPFIKEDIQISGSQLSIILAIPVILGSVLRVPFGYLTNIIGAKWVFFSSYGAMIPHAINPATKLNVCKTN